MLSEFIDVVLKKNKSNKVGLRDFIIRGSVGSFILKLVGIALSFGSSVLLARFLGAEGFGVYSYVLAIIHVLVVPTQLGFPQLLVRQIASYKTQMEWAYLKGLLWRANQFVVLISLIIILICLLGLWFYNGLYSDKIGDTFLYALPLILIYPLNALRKEALRGLRKVIVGLVPELIIKHGLLIILLLVFYFIYGTAWVTPERAIVLLVISLTVAFIFGALSLHHYLPESVKSSKSKFKNKQWLKNAIPFMILGGLQLINAKTDILMLGMLSTSENVGIYQVALRGSEFVAFPLLAVNMVAAPIFSELWTQNDFRRLQLLVTKSARAILLLSLPIALILIFGGDFVLSILFGQDFKIGSYALALLSIAHLINAGMGSVGTILQMTGNEKQTAYGVGISVILNVALNFWFIQIWGIEGAAVATCISIILWNIILYRMVIVYVGIYPSIYNFKK